MGMGSEMMDELWIAWSIAQDRIRELYRKKTWITGDGTQIKIRKMSDAHIANCIAHLEKGKWEWRQEYLELFHKEANRRINKDFKNV